MTAIELRDHFNLLFGMEQKWPKKYGVDAETYGNVCQEVFNHLQRRDSIYIYEHVSGLQFVRLALGPNGGIMFKNVELILE